MDTAVQARSCRRTRRCSFPPCSRRRETPTPLPGRVADSSEGLAGGSGARHINSDNWHVLEPKWR
eukprot:14647775-Alexandrium_andersonii.AAC.1